VRLTGKCRVVYGDLRIDDISVEEVEQLKDAMNDRNAAEDRRVLSPSFSAISAPLRFKKANSDSFHTISDTHSTFYNEEY